ESLNALAKELDPADETSEFGVMMGELNSVLSGVFPESKIYATADFSDPDNVLPPSFSVKCRVTSKHVYRIKEPE
ncbi:hypothetical protein ODQ85_25370, partial [Escherichia coli]|nr:hypothetical protein [Escherichia coli]